MKIHYLSCHSILEYDEVQLLTDLGHEVFANGAYIDPRGHITLPRPGIRGAKYYEDFALLASNSSKTNLPPELIDPFDLIIVMHQPDILINNWDRIRHKKVIWRTIGQSTSEVESRLAPLRADGLKIIRYSPNEEYIHNNIGSDILIRFYKDENELNNWSGHKNNVITFAQSLKGRRDHCHYDEIIAVMNAFNGTVYGPGNEDLGDVSGGAISYSSQIKAMQDAGVMIYGGTAPASYTLSFIEALMVGLPIVAINSSMSNIIYNFPFYEVDSILSQIDGITCASVDEMLSRTDQVLNDKVFAASLSKRQRDLAVEMFGKTKIIKQWNDFLNSI